tara:strand:- start:314 stop:562 length:249 start_codon:yes stop_codon:yes gene_type:complete
MKEEIVTYIIIDEEGAAPVSMIVDENDMPKIVLNRHYTIWLCQHRNLIPSCLGGVADEIINLLDSHLKDQRAIEKMGEEDQE